MSGMGYNHEPPFTVEESTLISLLQNRGIWPPNFATKAETLEWLAKNRWRVERRDK